MKPLQSCPHTGELISKLLAAKGNEAIALQNDPHLPGCPHCRFVFDQLSADLEKWQQQGPGTIAIDPTARIKSASANSGKLQPILIKVAAIAAASVLTGLIVSHQLLPISRPTYRDIAADYTLELSTDNSFPIDYFTEE